MPLLAESIDTARELYVHKLGAALKMEKTILEMLPKLEEAATDRDLKQTLARHRRETENHVRNLEKVFRTLGADPQEQPCPTIDGLEEEGESMLDTVDAHLYDAVILSGVVETEAHEIAVYDGLITKAKHMGEHDVVSLLQENLASEQHALQQARREMDRVARGTAVAV